MIYLGYSCKYLAFTSYFKSTHKAVDIPRSVTVDGVRNTMANEDVFMAYEGKIVKNGYASDYGYWIEYEVKDGNDTYLIASGHFDKKSALEVGKTYPRGTFVNKMGRTGSDSTGFHDHFRVTKNGTRVNPLEYCYAYTDWNVKGSLEDADIKWYTPISDIKGVERDSSRDQLKVLANALRVRKAPNLSGEVVGYAVTNDIYNDLEVVEADGYKWHRIYDGMWLAEVNIELLPKEIIDYKELYEQELAKNQKLELENKDLTSQLNIANDKLNQIRTIVG